MWPGACGYDFDLPEDLKTDFVDSGVKETPLW